MAIIKDVNVKYLLFEKCPFLRVAINQFVVYRKPLKQSFLTSNNAVEVKMHSHLIHVLVFYIDIKMIYQK